MKGICIKLGFNPQKNISLLQDGGSFFVYSSNMPAVTSCEHNLLLMSETVTFYWLLPEDENTELSIVFAILQEMLVFFYRVPETTPRLLINMEKCGQEVRQKYSLPGAFCTLFVCLFVCFLFFFLLQFNFHEIRSFKRQESVSVPLDCPNLRPSADCWEKLSYLSNLICTHGNDWLPVVPQ